MGLANVVNKYHVQFDSKIYDAFWVHVDGNDLHTKQLITRRGRITVLPVTDIIIRSVKDIAAEDGQKGLRFCTADGHIPYHPAWTAGVEYDEDAHEEPYEEETEDDDEDREEEWEALDPNLVDEDNPGQPVIETDQQDPDEQEAIQDVDQDDPVQEQEEHEDQQQQDGVCTSRYGRVLRPTATFQPTMGGQYHELVHLQQSSATKIQEYPSEFAQAAVNFILASRERLKMTRKKETCNLVTYSLAKGLKKFGGRAFDSAYGEMEQLHDRDCFKPINMRTMSQSERRKAMESLIFLLEKKVTKKIKSRL